MTAKVIQFANIKKDLEKKVNGYNDMVKEDMFLDGAAISHNLYELALELAVVLHARHQEELERATLEYDYAKDQARIHSNA